MGNHQEVVAAVVSSGKILYEIVDLGELSDLKLQLTIQDRSTSASLDFRAALSSS